MFETYCQTVTHYTNQDSRGENLPEHERVEKSVKQTGVPATTGPTAVSIALHMAYHD